MEGTKIRRRAIVWGRGRTHEKPVGDALEYPYTRRAIVGHIKADAQGNNEGVVEKEDHRDRVP